MAGRSPLSDSDMRGPVGLVPFATNAPWGYFHLRLVRNEAGAPADMEILGASPLLARLLGEDLSHLPGKCLSQIRAATPDGVWPWQSFMSYLVAAVAEDAPVRFTYHSVAREESYDLLAYPTGADGVATFITIAAGPVTPNGEQTERDRRYLQLLEGLCDGVWETDVDLRTTRVSRRLAQMLGYLPEEMVGRSLLEFMDETVVERAAPAFAPRADDSTRALTCSLRRKDGSSLLAGLEVAPLRAADGSPAGAFTTVTDMAGFRQARLNLNRGEERYRALVEMLPDAVFLVDGTDGRILEANQAASRMYGYGHEQLLALRNTDLSAEPDATRLATQTGQTSIPVRLHRRGDGSVFPVEIAARHFSWQGRPVHIAAVRDIGERLSMQESLAEALAEARRHRNETEALLAGARDLLREEDFATAAKSLFDRCRESLGASVGYVALRDGDAEQHLTAVPRPDEPWSGPDHAPSLVGLRARAYATGEPVWDNDFHAGEVAGRLPPGHAPLDSVLLAPLMVRGKAEGMLGFANKPEGFGSGDVQMVMAFAELLAVALSNSRTRNALRDSEERFRAYVTDAPYGLFVLDAGGYCIDVNPAACVLTGYSRQELLALRLRDITAPSSADSLGELVSALMVKRHGESELRFVRKDGAEPWVSVAAVHLSGSRYLVFASDISEHRRAEESLRDSEEKLRSMMEQSLEGIAITDSSGAVVTWNSAQERVTGLSREEVVGLPLWEVQFRAAPPERRQAGIIQRVQADMVEALRTGELPPAWMATGEREIVWPTGERRVMQSTVFPIRTARGYLLGSISRDVTEHVLAEKALRDSQARYSQLFEQMLNGFQLVEVVFDRSGTPCDYRYLEVNPAFERLTGLIAEHVIGRCAGEGLPGADPIWVETLGRVALAGEPAQLELYSESLDRYFEVRAFCPRPGQAAVLFADISERRLAEQALRESEAKFAMAFHDNTGLMVIATVDDGRFLDVNRAFYDTLGYTAEDMLGKTSLDIGLFAVPEQRAELVRLFRQDGSVRDHEILLYTKDRRLREGLFSATPMVVGDRQCWLCVVHDVTELKRAERALRRRATQLERLLQTAQQLSTSLDLEQVLSIVARQAHELLQADGCTLYLLDADERLLTPVVATHLHHEDLRLATPAEVDASLTGQAVRLRRALVLNDPPPSELGPQHEGLPEQEPERIMVAPFIGDGKVVGAMRVDRSGVPFDDDDLTLAQTFAAYAAAALKNAQAHERLQEEMRERQQAEARLLQSQKMESIGRLAGGVAHDFNNILTAITGFAEFVLDGLGPEAEAREDLQEVLRSAERATHLTRQLLAFSRRQTMEMRPVDLNVLVGDLGKLLGRLIGEHIELLFLPEEGLAPVLADSAQLEQVLMNLAVNAKDAMPGGGRLTVATHSVPATARLDYPDVALPEGDLMCLEVSDTGTGMSSEAMEHLFEPFYTTKELGKGTGLGLATVYGIVQQHGGDIRVRSEQGKGTTFSVYLPVLPGEPASQAPADGPCDAAHGGATVLLVEDEAVVRAVARRCLGQLGYSVLEASDGVEAIELVAQLGAAPSLLITDLVMPRMGGLELARRLRTDHPGLRVLYTSGYTEETRTLTDATDSGDVYLQKPFDARSLALKVSEALARP